jgi:hypothetical protein
VAGYSGTPLAQKLGIKPGHVVVQLGGPVGLLPDVVVRRRLPASADVVLFFATERAALERRLPALRSCIEPAAWLWVCWPKKASRVPTDITEDVIREVVLPTGLVDVKVCAIDDVWSGLKLVVRKELRAPRQPGSVP